MQKLKNYSYKSFFKLTLITAIPFSLIYLIPIITGGNNSDFLYIATSLTRSFIFGMVNSAVYSFIFVFLRKALSKPIKKSGVQFGIIVWLTLYGVNFLSFLMFPHVDSIAEIFIVLIQNYTTTLIFMTIIGIFISFFYRKFQE